MKISVVGAGNAGCLTALHYAYYGNGTIEVELKYDPTVLPEKVGQGTLLDAPKLLWLALGSDWYSNSIDATPKTGILYEGWGKVNEKFIHSFPLNSLALHYSPKKLQDTILSSGLFKVTEDSIVNIEDVDADYVFDCRGKPKSLDDYEELKSPVNAAILAMKDGVDAGQYWTRSVATPDGWAFVIPNTTNTTSYGYIYNKNISTKDEATKNFESIFDVEAKDYLYFSNYVAKNPVVDGRIILNGNRLFFLEPLEASAIQSYSQWVKNTCDVILYQKFGWGHASALIKEYIHQIENFILWHYQFGSKHDTKFWDYAKSLKVVDDRFDDFLSVAISSSWPEVRNIFYDASSPNSGYGQWLAWNFKNWYEGVTKCQ